MATNPYDDLKRASIIDALEPRQLGQPKPGVSTTMPVADPTRSAPKASTAPPPASLSGKRDQWSGPTTVTRGGDFWRLHGFDQRNFDNPDMQTQKYQAGRIFSRYDPNPQGLDAAMADPEFQSTFPNARRVSFDKIDFGDGVPIDVGEAFDPAANAGAAWQWLVPEGAYGGASGAPAGGASGGQAMAMGPSRMDQILQEIQALANGSESPIKRNELIDLLAQQNGAMPYV